MITFLITGTMTSMADTPKYYIVAGENNEYSGKNVTILGNNNVSYGDNSSVFSVFTKEELEDLGKIIDFKGNKDAKKSMLEYNLRNIDFLKNSDSDIIKLNNEIEKLQHSPNYVAPNLYLPTHSVAYPYGKVYTEEKLRSLGFKDPDTFGTSSSSGYHYFIMNEGERLNDNIIAEKNKALAKLEEIKNNNIEKYNKMKEIIDNKTIAGLRYYNLGEDKTLVRLLTNYKDTFHTENSKAEVQKFFSDYELMKKLAYFESDEYKEVETEYLKMKEIKNQIREKEAEKDKIWSEKKVVKETEIRNEIEDLERTNEEYNTRFEEIVDSHDETRGKREISEIVKTINTESISLGYNATTESKQSITIGAETHNKGEGSVVLGYGIQNEANNAVILGKNSTGKDNTVSVGSEGNERKIIFVADGELSSNSKDAINGSQLFKFKSILDTKLGDSDITHDYLANKLEKGNIISSTLKLTNNEGRIIGSDDLSIELKDSTVGFNHLNQDLKDLIKSKGNGVSNPTNINIKSENVTKSITDGNTIEYIGGKGTKASVEEIDTGVIVKYDVNIDNSTIKLDRDGNLTVNTDMFASKDASNLDDEDVIKWRDKLRIGNTSRDINESTNARLTLVNDNVNALGDKLEKFALKEDLKEKSTNAAIANIAAMSQIPQVSGDKLFSLGAGTAYHKGEFAGSVGISGQDTRKRFIYKLSGALNSKKEFTVGAGFNFNLGQINDPSVVKDDILDGKLKDIITKNNKNLEDKDNKILKLESELDKLRHENSDKFNNVLKDIQNLKNNQATRQHKIVLDGFETNKYNLSDKHLNILKNLVHSGLGGKITIIGYTDTVGKERPNLDLGLNRAKEVARFLASKGATIKYIRSGGYNQIVTASNIDGFKNRRVEIIVEY